MRNFAQYRSERGGGVADLKTVLDLDPKGLELDPKGSGVKNYISGHFVIILFFFFNSDSVIPQ